MTALSAASEPRAVILSEAKDLTTAGFYESARIGQEDLR